MSADLSARPAGGEPAVPALARPFVHGVAETPPGPTVRAESLLLVCSSGGHLAQLIALRPWWQDRRTRWVTFNTEDARSQLQGLEVRWSYAPTTRNIPNLIRNFMLALRMLAADRPDAILSTGAGVALPFFVLGRLLRIPTVYIEVFDRIDSATLTARLCKPFASQMLVQWDEQRAMYPDATVVGRLL